ncbi:MAG: lysozyme [Acidobacteriota bacterium]|nr:lysozyme [Acidobacteriota bacterium]
MASFFSSLLDLLRPARTDQAPAPVPASAVASGIDVSHLQGQIDWPRVAQAGISFAFVKATEGAGFVDPQFSANWNGIKDAGIIRGAYHFFHPAKPVAAQVDNFVNTVGELAANDLPPVLDLEEVITTAGDEWRQVPPGDRVLLAMNWLQAAGERMGRRPIVYTRLGFVASELPGAGPLAQYPLWIAHYTTQPSPAMPSIWSKWTFWQYSQSGMVGGVNGLVDLDRFDGSPSGLLGVATAGISAGETAPGL